MAAAKLLQPEDSSQIPSIMIDVLKDGRLVETITLENNAVFKLGRHSQTENFVHLMHESISMMHAALVLDEHKGLLLIDLGSKYGTKLNGKQIEPNIPTPVNKKGDIVQFGASTRSYKITVDYSRMLAAQMKALKELEEEVDQLAELDKD